MNHKSAPFDLICFLDADDWLSSDIIQISVEKFRKGYLNIWGATELKDNTFLRHETIIAEGLKREELIANVIYMIPDERYTLGNYFRAVWGKIFEKRIIDKNSIAFSENLYIGEDAVFLTNYIMYVSGINVVADYGYYYNRINNGSLTEKYKEGLYEQSIFQYEAIKGSVIQNSLEKNEYIVDSFINFRWWMVTSLIDNAVKGVLGKKLCIKDLLRQSKRWVKKYKVEMKETAIDSSRVGKRHRNLYRHREKINSMVLVIYYLLPQVAIKILKKMRLKKA